MSKSIVLIVEDDEELRAALKETVELAGFHCVVAENAKTAWEKIMKEKPQIIISDIQMPDGSGRELLKRIQHYAPEVPVILMTAYGNISEAVNCLQNGAVDYLAKPFEPESLIEKISRYAFQTENTNFEPVATDEKSKLLLATAKRVAKTDATILVSGESGTGKEVLARYIHANSDRNNKAFVAINCAAIPESMLEATLFGYEKGAFTGAYKSTPGKFEQAQDGTILLDEITEMDLALQAKLLRVLQEREVERIGANKIISLNVRVIATTNQDMLKAVQDGRFREDLYYRLNVFPLYWPPLRERKNDLLPMAQFLIAKHAKSHGKGIPTLDAEATKKMMNYDWPGNAREMDNVIQRAMILHSGGVITAEDILILENASTPKQSKKSTKLSKVTS